MLVSDKLFPEELTGSKEEHTVIVDPIGGGGEDTGQKCPRFEHRGRHGHGYVQNLDMRRVFCFT